MSDNRIWIEKILESLPAKIKEYWTVIRERVENINLQRTWTVMRAEFLHIFRDPLSLGVALAMPLQLLFLCGYCFRLEMNNLPLAVLDMDQSQESRNYITTIDNTPFFHIKYNLANYTQAKELLSKGTTRCSIVIPPGFSRSIHENRPANVQTLVDGSETLTASTIINYISGINASYSIEMTTALMKKYGQNINLEPISLDARSWYNQSISDIISAVASMFSLAIMAFVPILAALAIVREKESGSIQQIFASPIKPYEYIAGKMTPYVIILTIDFIVIIFFGLWYFNVPFRGNIITFSLFTLLMIFASVAIGFFISTLTNSQLTAMLFAVLFTLMPAILFSDINARIDNMPEGWRLYSYIFPAQHYTGISRAEILKGASLFGYWKDALSLIIYCTIIFSICAWRIRDKKI
ncbi:MAG: ABC transporter permease [Spirochaetota bacterium]|nr:ABC transporter permease [Spirochaetota bacterium]